MDLTTKNLVEVLATCSDGPTDCAAEIVALARQAQPAFAATLYSAWQAEGAELSVPMRYDLDAARARLDYYRSVAARLMAVVPSLRTIKGLEVAALYPDGLARYMNDLDVIAATQADLWRAVGLLRADGWELDTATFSRLDADLHVMVSLRREHEDRYQLPYSVELATYYTLGNSGGIPPIVALGEQWQAPAIKNMLMLLHERYEQPFRARDLVDAALLHEALSDTEVDSLHRAIVALGLAAEYSELVRLVARAGLGPLRALPGGRATTTRVRVRRLARGAAFFARPVAGTGRHLQRRHISSHPGAVEALTWAAVQRVLPVTTAVRAGLLAFGLPLCGPLPDVTEAVLRRRRKVAWADTPVGRFLLTIGDEVTQSAVDELSGGEAAAPSSPAESGDEAGRADLAGSPGPVAAEIGR